MKKIIALVLALILMVSVAPMAFASTTTLTTTVPEATYTLNIPADTEVEFGRTSVTLGNVTITDSENFAVGKNVKVTITYDAFKADDPNITTTIPYVLKYNTFDTSTFMDGDNAVTKNSGDYLTFHGTSSGSVTTKAVDSYNSSKYTYVTVIGITMNSSDWGKALAGDYTSTITFTSEVVAG